MPITEKEFTVIHQEIQVRIEILLIGTDTAYLARFPDRPPLMLTRARDFNSSRFWTSVPEGRQGLAEEIGSLISAHIRNNP